MSTHCELYNSGQSDFVQLLKQGMHVGLASSLSLYLDLGAYSNQCIVLCSALHAADVHCC